MRPLEQLVRDVRPDEAELEEQLDKVFEVRRPQKRAELQKRAKLRHDRGDRLLFSLGLGLAWHRVGLRVVLVCAGSRNGLW